MKFNLRRIVFCILTFFSLELVAEDTQYWTSVQITSPLRGQFRLMTEVIGRYSEDREEVVTRSLRAGFTFGLNQKLVYGFYLENRDTDSDSSDEVRFVNQLQNKWVFEDYNASLRFRWELREFSESKEYQNRLRLQGRIYLEQQKFFKMTPFLAGEYLRSMNDIDGRPSGTVEIRNQAGVSTEIGIGRFELGYIFRSVETPTVSGEPASTAKSGVLNTVFRFNF